MCEYDPNVGQIKYTLMKNFVTYTINRIPVFKQHPLVIATVAYKAGVRVEILDDK